MIRISYINKMSHTEAVETKKGDAKEPLDLMSLSDEYQEIKTRSYPLVRSRTYGEMALLRNHVLKNVDEADIAWLISVEFANEAFDFNTTDLDFLIKRSNEAMISYIKEYASRNTDWVSAHYKANY